MKDLLQLSLARTEELLGKVWPNRRRDIILMRLSLRELHKLRRSAIAQPHADIAKWRFPRLRIASACDLGHADVEVSNHNYEIISGIDTFVLGA
jgi:hypothetical protein